MKPDTRLRASLATCFLSEALPALTVVPLGSTAAIVSEGNAEYSNNTL